MEKILPQIRVPCSLCHRKTNNSLEGPTKTIAMCDSCLAAITKQQDLRDLNESLQQELGAYTVAVDAELLSRKRKDSHALLVSLFIDAVRNGNLSTLDDPRLKAWASLMENAL